MTDNSIFGKKRRRVSALKRRNEDLEIYTAALKSKAKLATYLNKIGWEDSLKKGKVLVELKQAITISDISNTKRK